MSSPATTEGPGRFESAKVWCSDHASKENGVKAAKVAVTLVALAALAASAMMAFAHFGLSAHTLVDLGLHTITPFGAGIVLAGTALATGLALKWLLPETLCASKKKAGGGEGEVDLEASIAAVQAEAERDSGFLARTFGLGGDRS